MTAITTLLTVFVPPLGLSIHAFGTSYAMYRKPSSTLTEHPKEFDAWVRPRPCWHLRLVRPTIYRVALRYVAALALHPRLRTESLPSGAALRRVSTGERESRLTAMTLRSGSLL
jgi:hypothetical protein